MITAYLKVNVGFLLALGINCYRRESESWDTFSQAVNLQSSCVSSGSTSGMVLTLPPLGGGAMENAFHLPQSLLRRDFRWKAFTFVEKKNISDIYICYVFNEVRVLRLNSKMLWVLPFPHLQPLTFLSPTPNLPPSFPIMPLWEYTTPLRGSEGLVVQHALTQSLYAGRSKRLGPTWKLLRLAVVWRYRHLTFFADHVNI